MSQPQPSPVPPAQPTAEVPVELPAKVTTTTEVDAAPEVADASDAGPDAATQAMEAQPKE